MKKTLTWNKLLATIAVLIFCFAVVPMSAYAADIANTIKSSKDSVKVGQSTTLTTSTTYQMWGIGPFGIPFMSDWLNEIPYSYYAKPVVTNHTGNTDGDWSKESAIRASSSVWQQKSSPSWFYGKTTWSGTYTVKATAASGSAKSFAHGQTKDWRSSTGYTAFADVKSIN